VSEPQQMPTSEFLRSNDGLKEIAFRSERSAPLFADGANLQWVWAESRKHLLLVIYERGEGPTPASGSSACAAACAAFGLGLIDNEVDVAMPAGSLAVRLEGKPTKISRVTLIGDAHRILDGMVSNRVIAGY
jgi:diaminopimelate epimerase